MEGDEIGVILSRVSELRLKINNCIEKETKKGDSENGEGGENSTSSIEEAESLFSIRDALESLEEILSSLQALQQQQRYEKEATLQEINHSRKVLLKKIKEYKGDDLDVIHELSTFASETVEHDDDLLLPPYPSHPHPLILDKGYSSNFPSKHRNGVNNHEERKTPPQTLDRNPPRYGLKHILGLAAKTLLTLVSVVSVLSLAGFEPRVRRRSSEFGVMDMFQKTPALENEEKLSVPCPPGKVLVMVNGEQKCLVKERVAIPFEPVVTTPDVNYGCG